MARKAFDESGDSDDLQALFDSIAAGSPKPKLEVVHPADTSGDSDELQALFDSVSAESVSHVPVAEVKHEHSCDTVFQKVGHMTRQLHDTLRQLGYDKALQDAASALPDIPTINCRRKKFQHSLLFQRLPTEPANGNW